MVASPAAWMSMPNRSGDSTSRPGPLMSPPLDAAVHEASTSATTMVRAIGPSRELGISSGLGQERGDVVEFAVDEPGDLVGGGVGFEIGGPGELGGIASAGDGHRRGVELESER